MISAIQLLKLSGFSPIIVYASDRHREHLISLGATHVIDRNDIPLSDLASTVQKITTEPVKLVFDAVGPAEAQQVGYDLLSSGGSLITLLPTDIQSTEDKFVVSVFGTVHPPTPQEFGKLVYKHLTKLIEDGLIKVCSFSIMFLGGPLNALLAK